jgi:hypothetical protein
MNDLICLGAAHYDPQSGWTMEYLSVDCFIEAKHRVQSWQELGYISLFVSLFREAHQDVWRSESGHSIIIRETDAP